VNVKMAVRLSLGVSLVIGGLVSAAAGAGATWYVGPGYYDTISNAVKAASDGDTIVINVATQTECGIVITKSLTIQGQGMNSTIVQGATSRSNATDRIFMMNNAAKTLTVKDMTLRYGYYSNNIQYYTYGGAALFNAGGTVTVQNCSVVMNDTRLTGGSTRGTGGAFCQIPYNYDPGSASFTILNCLVASNVADFAYSFGGGIEAKGGSLWIEGSTFVNNQCLSSGQDTGGGGVFGSNLRAFTMRNSTLVANYANAGGAGLNVSMASGYTGMVYNSTISSNSGSPTWSGADLALGGSLKFYSALLAGNGSDYNIRAGTGSVLSFSNCLLQSSTIYNSGSATVTTNNCLVGDPKLLGLAYNGGPTPTLALQSGSPCIDAGSNPFSLGSDQRGAGYGRIRGAAVDIGAYEKDAGGLIYSRTNFAEAFPYLAGAIDNTTPLLITLNGGNLFTGTDNSQITNNVIVGNLPDGLVVSMVRTNGGTNAVVMLLGGATHNTSNDNVNNLTFTFQDSAFNLGNASQLPGYATTLSIQFVRPVQSGSLTYSGTNFQEDAIWNDGRIATTLTNTLSGDTFNTPVGGDFVAAGWVVPSHIPAGLTAVVTRVDATNVNVTLIGRAAAHAAANSANNLGLSFQNAAFVGGNASVIDNAAATDLSVSFMDPAANVQLLYGGTVFNEAAANDGSIATTNAITLTNDFFEGSINDDFVAKGWVVPANVPVGLTAVVTRVDLTHLNATLIGQALANSSVSNVYNLTFAFTDRAFHNTAALAVTNAARSDLQILFSNPVATYGRTSFAEFWQNDGSIGNNPLTISLVGDTFTGTNGENFIASAKAVASHVPSGLTASVVRLGNGQVAFSLLGNASPHNSADSIANLTLTFQDGAFAQGGAGAVANVNRGDLSVTFVGSSASSNFWVSVNTGSDTTGNGSFATPWQSIPFALNNAAVRADAYDTINLMAGTYTVTNVAVSKVVALRGASMDQTFVQAAGQFGVAANRLLALNNTCTLSDMTLRYGNLAGHGSAVTCVADAMFERCRIVSNKCTGAIYYDGSAIYCSSGLLTMRGCEIKDNIAQTGGTAGVLAWSPATVVISNCLFTGNQSPNGAGGLYAYVSTVTILDSTFRNNSNFSGVDGGAAFTVGSSAASTADVERCTVVGNSGTNVPAVNFPGISTIVECTVFGNTCSSGIGIGSGTAWLQNCTVVNNKGSISAWYSATMHFVSSIVALNSTPGGGPDIVSLSGVAPTADHCFIGNGDNARIAATLSYIGTTAAPLDPMLLPLADNGGLTWTCAPLKGSPVIDHGSNPLGLATDQRGGKYARLVGAAVDIGAFEYKAPAGTALFMY